MSVVLDSLSSVFAHYIIFTYNIAMMYVRMHLGELRCVIAVSGL